MLTLLAGAFAVHAQGTVSLANYGVLSPYIYAYYRTGNTTVSLGGTSVGPTPTIANYSLQVHNGNDWTVELYGAVGANVPSWSLLPLGATATLANGINDTVPGTWASTAYAEVPGTVAGSIATVQLFLWYNEGGAITSYAQALADGVPILNSSAANVILGGPSSSGPPSTPASLPSAALGDLVDSVPEPDTFALSAIAGGVTLLRYFLRRR